ncbi:unnamed protein product [Chondrus crispus]|uniref:Transmembrane protein 19 n=1 Tax=Chondrus crispus TaxID=2769 RepID=R7QHC8_CHOCR|nr:unnamed protein product [Chondrus crispus]CDF37158.1 unnamed protein product [Chondrus crispus]|eukprot:XP_005716977.1 unnamed protein product [Chondrus crispus]
MASPSELARALSALALASALGLRGRRSQSLSPTGALAAFLVGFLSCLASVRFGATLIAFYLASTRATRFRAAEKARLEDGFSTAHGNRSAAQVFASSLPAVAVALFYLVVFRFDAPVTPAFPTRSCLLLAYLLFFAACAGDTFSSEVGFVLSPPGVDPLLITQPWRRVPRGTNGGVSFQGTVASAVGGVVVGSVYFLASPEWSFSQLWLVLVGLVGGVVGSILDSVIGAIMQASWLDTASGKVLKVPPPKEAQVKGRFQHICGFDILSGESVNLLAGVFTMAAAPLLMGLFAVEYPGGI